MSRRKAVKLDSHTLFGIFGLVTFQSDDGDEPKWAQIGTAKRNQQGFLELRFDHQPHNLARMQIRPLAEQAKA